jgi:hypothetical protein
MSVETIAKHANMLGVQRALIDGGLLPAWTSFEKEAQGAEIAAQAAPGEAHAIGQAITPKDIESLVKIVELLSSLQQQSGGAAAPPGAAPPPPPPGAAGPPPGAAPPLAGPPPGAAPPPPPAGAPA